MNETGSISVDELARRCAAGDVEILDVRTPAEFQTAHVVGARNLPLDRLDPQAVVKQRNGATRPLYVICQAGSRGATACRKLLEAGCANVVNVEGGTQAWIEAGLPVVRGRKTISLERQVRIVAGAIVLVAAVLGLALHPYFTILAALVGAGLLFAGLTDTCGMAWLLAKMPWNQRSACDT